MAQVVSHGVVLLSLHILVSFILNWWISCCLVVSRLVMLEPYSKKQTTTDSLYGWAERMGVSLWVPVRFVIS